MSEDKKSKSRIDSKVVDDIEEKSFMPNPADRKSFVKPAKPQKKPESKKRDELMTGSGSDYDVSVGDNESDSSETLLNKAHKRGKEIETQREKRIAEARAAGVIGDINGFALDSMNDGEYQDYLNKRLGK